MGFALCFISKSELASLASLVAIAYCCILHFYYLTKIKLSMHNDIIINVCSQGGCRFYDDIAL